MIPLKDFDLPVNVKKGKKNNSAVALAMDNLAPENMSLTSS